MTFRLAPAANSAACFGACGTLIAAEGEITDATPEDFLAFLRANAVGRGRVEVFINSPGGKIVGGIELGKIFRRLGVSAYVAQIGEGAEGTAARPVGGICYSACVYALMGAKRRVAPRDSRIGIHRMFAYDGGSRRYDNGEMAAMLRRYSKMMGVNPELIAATEQGASDSIRILTPAEITRWARLARVVTTFRLAADRGENDRQGRQNHMAGGISHQSDGKPHGRGQIRSGALVARPWRITRLGRTPRLATSAIARRQSATFPGPSGLPSSAPKFSRPRVPERLKLASSLGPMACDGF